MGRVNTKICKIRVHLHYEVVGHFFHAYIVNFVWSRNFCFGPLHFDLNVVFVQHDTKTKHKQPQRGYGIMSSSNLFNLLGKYNWVNSSNFIC